MRPEIVHSPPEEAPGTSNGSMRTLSPPPERLARVREIDPQFFDRFDNEPLDELPEWTQPRADGAAFAREFDARLAGRVSKLLDYSPRAPAR